MTAGRNDQVKRKLWLSLQVWISLGSQGRLSRRREAWRHQQSTDQVWPDTQVQQSSTGLFSQGP